MLISKTISVFSPLIFTYFFLIWAESAFPTHMVFSLSVLIIILYVFSSFKEKSYYLGFSASVFTNLCGSVLIFVSICSAFLTQFFLIKESSSISSTPNIGVGMILLNIINYLIVSPLFEEYLFRRLLFVGMIKSLSFYAVKANLIQAILFSLFHFDINKICYTFVLGVLLGIVMLNYPFSTCVLFHALYNLTVLFLYYKLLVLSPTTILIVCSLFFVLSFYEYIEKRRGLL